MSPDILAVFCTYDRLGVLKPCLETMAADPGLPFRLWIVDNGSAFANMYGPESGHEHLDFLIEWYRQGHIEKLIINDANQGIYFSFNVLMALAKLSSKNPKIKIPEFIYLACDDMIYEPNWLAECYQTLLDCEKYPKGKTVIVSPFHCQDSDGTVKPKMGTIDTYTVGNRTYEIKHMVSGNTWFMRSSIWLDFMNFYPVTDPIRQGDWTKLRMLHSAGYRCTVTPSEMAHHNLLATGYRTYDRIHNYR